MLKRFFCVFLVLVSLLMFYGCSSNSNVEYFGEKSSINAAKKDSNLQDALSATTEYLEDMGYEFARIAVNPDLNLVIYYTEGIVFEDAVLDELNLVLDTEKAYAVASELFDSKNTSYDFQIAVTVKSVTQGWGWGLITNVEDGLNIHYGMRTDQLPILVEE